MLIGHGGIDRIFGALLELSLKNTQYTPYYLQAVIKFFIMNQRERERRDFNLRKQARTTKNKENERELDPTMICITSDTDMAMPITGGAAAAVEQENTSNSNILATPREPEAEPVHRCSGGSGRARSTSPSGGAPTTRELANLIGEVKDSIISMFAEHTVLMKSKMDTVIEEVGTFKKKVDELKASVDFSSKRVDNVENVELPGIRKNIDQVKADLEDKLLRYEIHDRKLNLLFYGAEHLANENVYATVHGVVSDLLQVTPEQVAKTIPLVNAHRILRKKNIESQRDRDDTSPDPIIVRFVRMIDRDRVLRAFERPPSQPNQRESREEAPSLETSANKRRITVRTDLPVEMKRERGRLASVAYKLRKKDNVSTRILVNGTKVILQTRKKNQGSSMPAPWSNWKELH